MSRHIRHVVTEIVSPWGPAVDERPRVLSEVERLDKWRVKREAKLERRRIKREGEIENGVREEMVEGA